VHYERRVRTADALWQKLYHYIQWRRMRRYELSVCRRFRKVIVPSPQARNQLLSQAPGLDVDVVPFGITLPQVPTTAGSPEDKLILFVGAMGRPFNVEAATFFCQRIWPRIRAKEPDAEFWIVGSNPPPHVCQLAQMDANIKVTGFVDDLVPFYARASVFVAPLLVGGGVVTKILDAMAMFKPVVTTSIANEGIGALSGRDLVIADEPSEFAEQVVRLLRDPTRRQLMGQNGKNYVEENFSWSGIINRLERIYDEMMTNS
jgi:glycosyltransferase involved in cell wall biosynthesis